MQSLFILPKVILTIKELVLLSLFGNLERYKKNITYTDTNVTILSALNEVSKAQVSALCEELIK